MLLEYYTFTPHAQPPEDGRGYTLRKHKSKADITGISLRTMNNINYAPMMLSDDEDGDDEWPKKESKILPKPSGPSPMVLRAHASISNNKQKHFYTKPVPVKPVQNQPTATETTDESENDQNKLNIEVEHVETDTKEKVIGTFVTKTVGIRKHKKSCKANCRLCCKSCDNVKELNHHHCKDHDIQFCADCGKDFNTQRALDKHCYVHKELKFVCEVCGQGFLFDSQLEQHKLTKNLGYTALHAERLW